MTQRWTTSKRASDHENDLPPHLWIDDGAQRLLWGYISCTSSSSHLHIHPDRHSVQSAALELESRLHSFGWLGNPREANPHLEAWIRDVWDSEFPSIAYVDTSPPVDLARATSLRDFLNAPLADNEGDFVIDGCLRRGEVVMITGYEGHGKTTFVHQIAAMCAAGVHPFTGEPHHSIGNVLVVDCESTKQQLHERWQRFRSVTDALASSEDALDCLHLIATFGEPIDWDEVRWAVDDFAPDLIVIGSLYKGADGELAEDGYSSELQRRLEGIASNAGLIIETHTPHGDFGRRPRRPYGHSSWLRWPAFGFHLDKSGKITRWREDRAVRDWPNGFERGAPWPWMPTTEVVDNESPTKEATNYRDAVLKFFTAHRGEEFTKTAVAERVSGRSSAIAKIVQQLASEGRLEQRPGDRRSVLYSMPKEVLNDLI